MNRPSVVFQPHVSKYLLRGVDIIANAVRPTLGPLPRNVAYESAMRTRTPELLSDASTLARRIIQIGDDPSDVGAMLMRQAVWGVGDRVGDGAATTAVLAQAMAHQTYKAVAAGANAMRVRTGLQQGVNAATEALRAQATPVSTQKDLTQIARSYCHDNDLAKLLGEVYSIVGPGGFVEVQGAHGRTIEREYVEGAFWRNTGWISSAFSEDRTMKRASLQDAAVMLIDGRISETESFAKAIGQTLAAGHKSIAIICIGMPDIIIGVLAHNHAKGTFKCLPIKALASSIDRKAMFDDLAVMTGGTVLAGGYDADLSMFSPDMLGKVRRIWADSQQFGIVAGKGSPKALRAHIAMLRARMGTTKEKEEIAALRKRVGRLTGGTALISVGAQTEAEQKLRQAVAERSVNFMHSVTDGGMVAGGGAALLACQAAVAAAQSDDPDVCAGINAIARALEEPMRAIAANAGIAEAATVARARREGDGFGLNALNGEIVDMRAAGIVDSATVLEQALASAASVASMLLTTDVVIRHRKPETAMQP
jgi:chaperonin GroEL